MIDIKIYDYIENSELKNYWDQLYQINLDQDVISHPFIFNNYDWNKSWVINIKDNKKLFICILVKINDTPILLIPMLLRRVLNFNFAELIGGKETDYQNILINKILYSKNKRIILKKLRDIFRKKKIYYLRNKSINDELTINFFKDLFNYSYIFKYDESSYLKLNKSGLNLPKKVHKNIIRTKKKHEITSYTIKKNDKDFDEVLDKLIKTKNIHYLSNRVKEMPKERIIFYRDIALKEFSQLSCTKINNNFSSFHLGIKDRDTLIYLLPTYEKKFSSLSPGWIHLDFLIQNSISNNLKTLDLTFGNESYKKRLKCHKLNIFYVFAFNNLLILPLVAIEIVFKRLYNSSRLRYYFYLIKVKLTK